MTQPTERLAALSLVTGRAWGFPQALARALTGLAGVVDSHSYLVFREGLCCRDYRSDQSAGQLQPLSGCERLGLRTAIAPPVWRGGTSALLPMQKREQLVEDVWRVPLGEDVYGSNTSNVCMMPAFSSFLVTRG